MENCGSYVLVLRLIRQKYRWLALEIISEKNIGKESFISALKHKIYELFGSFGDVSFRVEEYDSQRGFCIIRCLREDLRRLRVALVLLRDIQGTPVVMNDLYCSGTLKKLREELKKRRLFISLLENT